MNPSPDALDMVREWLCRLEEVQPLPTGNYRTRCPVCTKQTLLLVPKDGKVVFKCDTGCGTDLISRVVQSRAPHNTEPPTWEPVIPFDAPRLPPFPIEALPSWMRAFVEAEAARTQTPLDLAGMLTLAAAATAVAGTREIGLGSGWREPLNLFVLIALPPGSRKSGVFTSVTLPLEEYEREANQERAPQIAASKAERDILEKRLEAAKTRAAKAKPEDREEEEEATRKLAEELESFTPTIALRLTADDCTPEQLASLMASQGGRIAILSPEGDTFDIISGRYNDKGANFGVYLKGHAGDALYVDRVGRAGEYLPRPALTLGLALQPEVLQGLSAKPGFRGRGLLGRFLYALPQSNIGFREVKTPPMPEGVKSDYRTGMRALLALTPEWGDDDQRHPVTLSLHPDAHRLFQTYQQHVEYLLRPDEELHSLQDWGAKLSGATARLAGILHLAAHGETRREVSEDSIANAIRLAQYLSQHAKAAYDTMGCDADVEKARVLLEWVRRRGQETFTKRDVHSSLRARFRQSSELDKPLTLLCERGFLRQDGEEEKRGAGRPSGPVYRVNPLTQNPQYPQNSPGERQ